MSVISEVHVGEPNDNWPFEERALIHFHNFANLRQPKGIWLRSSEFTCAGYEWYLKLYPRGCRNGVDGMVSVFLGSELSSKIVVDFDITIKNKTGDNFIAMSEVKMEFPRPNKMTGWKVYASRDGILDESNEALNNGTLTFEVRIRAREDYICREVTPKSSLADDLYNHLYQDEGSSDIAFMVKGHVYYAHKNILKARVPELAQLAEPYDAENSIPINDVEPDIFETMLAHVYGNDIGASYWEDHAKQVLDASGKYGFAELKSVAEAWHVKNLHLNFTVDNVVDELLYADGKNCPLLKKAAMDFIVEHGREVIESDSYGKLDESPELRKEVMKASFSINERKPVE